MTYKGEKLAGKVIAVDWFIMKIIKRSIIIVFLLSFSFLYLISNKNFIIINKTNEPIRATNFQYARLDTEPTISEMESYTYRYTVESHQSRALKVHRNNLLNKSLYISIDFSYKLGDSEKEKYRSLKGTTFSSEPQYARQRAYCSFQINVYPDNKTTVTPIRKWGCINPVYYYQPPLQHNN